MAYCKDIHFINGCNIVNTAGTGDFSKQYKATYTGEIATGIDNVNDNLNLNVNGVIKVIGDRTKRLTIADYDEVGRRVK